MRRRVARPFSPTVRPTRIVSLLLAVALLALFYDRAKQPETWTWFTGEKAAEAADVPPGPDGPDWKKIDANVVPGPNDRDPAERDLGKALLELVRDKKPLRPQEMAAYWRLMKWSLAEPFRDLEKRARPEVPFIQIWEQPENYRGELIRLRLHLTRVLEFKASERNDGPTQTVYEAWGWTDDSKSLPYVVVFPERPEGLPLGDDVRGEIVFVGYFLKLMSYTPADASPTGPLRAAPLLVGRARLADAPPPRKAVAANDFSTPVIITIVLGLVVILGLGFGSMFRRPKPRPTIGGSDPPEQDLGLGTLGPDPEFRLDLSPPADRGILPPAPPRPDEPS